MSNSLVARLVYIINPGATPTSDRIFHMVLRMMSTALQACPDLVSQFHTASIGPMLKVVIFFTQNISLYLIFCLLFTHFFLPSTHPPLTLTLSLFLPSFYLPNP